MPSTDSRIVDRKPRVFSLEPLHSSALKLARLQFDLVLPGEDGFENWRQEAEGLMARNAVVSPEDVAVLAENKLRYISKQGEARSSVYLERD